MINSIYVDGLRSLNDFKLDLQPGLNVLVGPNGSGKSNILSAFELISKLSHLDTLNPIDSIGAIFLEELFDNIQKDKKINLNVNGTTKFNVDKNNVYFKKYKNILTINYKYSCEISFDPKLDMCTFFDKQSLYLKLLFGKNRNCIEEFCGTFVKEKLNIETCDILNHFAISEDILKFRSLIHELSLRFSPLQPVTEDLDTGGIYNIDPRAIRHNIEKITSPHIKHNGSGLLSTLLKIYENFCENEKLIFEDDSSNLNYRDIYETIIYFLKKISPQICELIIKPEFENGGNPKRINGKILFENEKSISISKMSDGTIKWLTLITALLTTKNTFVLEEPEHYFHPVMQQLVTDLMRETTEVKNNVVIFSTHSETILNMLNPEEVILTFFRDGKTLAKRIDDPDELQKEIQESGFGIGWYFVAGCFDYENICPTWQ